MHEIAAANGRLKVLHVGPQPPPIGGVAAALQMILASPALLDVDHQVLNTSLGRPTEIVGHKPLTFQRAWRGLSRMLATATSIWRVRPDLVHFQCGSESLANQIGDFLMLWVGWLMGVRMILHLHVDPAMADLPGRRPFRRWLFGQLIRPVHAIFTLTEEYRDFLSACAAKPRLYVVPNMCEETLATLPVERPREPQTVCVIFLGRLTQPKGFFDLLEVAVHVRDVYPALRFEIAGLPSTPDDEARVQAFLQRHNLEPAVKLLGAVTHDAKLALFRRADILIAPSYAESFGMTVLEAMAAGLPVVASRVGGFRNLVQDGQTGYLVEPGDIKALSRSLVTLIQNRDRRLQMGKLGRRRYLEHYAAQRIGDVIAQAYREVLVA